MPEENNQQQSRRLSPETRTGLRCISAISAPQTRPKNVRQNRKRWRNAERESNQQETAGDTGREITTDGGSGTGGDFKAWRSGRIP
ncbi:hypothetical protein KCP77_12930 [Salmonella enterica subsp. enterica]|nr:hypothetical protein KCP77_12930 [Salmonella enterica subsp. enterica]